MARAGAASSSKLPEIGSKSPSAPGAGSPYAAYGLKESGTLRALPTTTVAFPGYTAESIDKIKAQKRRTHQQQVKDGKKRQIDL